MNDHWQASRLASATLRRGNLNVNRVTGARDGAVVDRRVRGGTAGGSRAASYFFRYFASTAASTSLVMSYLPLLNMTVRWLIRLRSWSTLIWSIVFGSVGRSIFCSTMTMSSFFAVATS